MTMAYETIEARIEASDLGDRAAQNTLAANPLVGVRGRDIFDSARALAGQVIRNPGSAAKQYLSFLGELGRIATGGSAVAPDPKDKRFADPAWKESAAYRALAQAYLAWGGALNRFIDEASMDKRDAERARFVVSLLVDALAPTNCFVGNPAALKRLVEERRTAGASRHAQLRRL
jgi:polyhydroxyalkanoate synthase